MPHPEKSATEGSITGPCARHRTKCLLLDEPLEGIAPALSGRLSEVFASLKGKDLTLLMPQSDVNRSRGLIDVEFTIERSANLASA
jgi:branched-chain amino acid transport system ATP-binding protein